jgi:hypothetical protein
MVTKSPKSPALCSRRSRVLVHPGSPEARKTNNYSLKESARTHTSENGKTGKKLSKKVLRRLKAADEAEVMELGREWRRAVREAKDPLPVDRALVLDGYWQQHAVAPVPSYSRFTTPASAARHGPVVWWLDGYEGTIVRGGVTVIGGLPKTGKTALACNIVAERSRQGKHILIWHSGEDSDAKWARRIERMGGKLAYVRFAADLMHLWAALEWESPDLVVIDPLQQFIGGGAKNDESTRNVMNELTREARRLDIPIIAVMHRKAHYHQGKLVGSEAVEQVARIIHSVERGRREYEWVLRRAFATDAPAGETMRFHTYTTGPDEPVLAAFDSGWEAPEEDTQDKEEAVERYIRELTKDRPIPVRSVKKDVADHAWIKYRPHLERAFPRMGYRSVRAGAFSFGVWYWVPSGWRYHGIDRSSGRERPNWQRKDGDYWATVDWRLIPLPDRKLSEQKAEADDGMYPAVVPGPIEPVVEVVLPFAPSTTPTSSKPSVPTTTRSQAGHERCRAGDEEVGGASTGGEGGGRAQIDDQNAIGAGDAHRTKDCAPTAAHAIDAGSADLLHLWRGRCCVRERVLRPLPSRGAKSDARCPIQFLSLVHLSHG